MGRCAGRPRARTWRLTVGPSHTRRALGRLHGVAEYLKKGNPVSMLLTHEGALGEAPTHRAASAATE